MNTTGWTMQGDAHVGNIMGTADSEMVVCSLNGPLTFTPGQTPGSSGAVSVTLAMPPSISCTGPETFGFMCTGLEAALASRKSWNGRRAGRSIRSHFRRTCGGAIWERLPDGASWRLSNRSRWGGISR